MTTQQLNQTNRNNKTTDATDGSYKLSPFLQLAEARMRHRPIRLTFPLRRRESCVTRRAMLAALREAEFDEWMASGGDFLSSTYQPIH